MILRRCRTTAEQEYDLEAVPAEQEWEYDLEAVPDDG